MYRYSFDDNTTKKIEESNQNSKNLLERFNDVDNKYNTLSKSNANLNLEKLEYNTPTENEIRSRAKNSLEDYKTKSLSAIEDKYSSKINQIDDDKQQVIDSTKESVSNLEGKYDSIKEATKNDAIKRGLARSSIVINTLNKVDMQKLASISELQKESNAKIERLNSSKNSLENQKQIALSDFDIAYAVKLQDEINSINTEIEKNKQAVIKYNNEVENLMAKWQKEQEDDEYNKITNLAKIASQYGISVFDTLKQNEKYAIASEYFAGMNKTDALNELNNNSAYKTALGKINYNKLIDEISSR